MSVLIEPALAGVTRIASDASLPRPHLAIVGAIHGNERCGLLAIERLRADFARGARALRAGTLVLVHGNPEATAEQRRYTQSGVDLNRTFDFRFVDELAPALWEPEHHRALALRPLLDSVDALLDLHSTTAPTPAFAIASRVPASLPFARALGLEYLTLGWDGPGLLGDRVLLARLTRRERPGVAVECGQHDDEAAPELAYRCALRALAHFGLIEPLAEGPPPTMRTLMVRAAVKRLSVSFCFERPLHGMQALEAGDVIGHGDHLTVTVRHRCYAVMPNDDVPVGDDMLYIAEDWADADPGDGHDKAR
ncbi:MAG: succinylglutamate desuccinylase [Myxococcaceae bacterium]|nr:succinylglutamate desuccinylase [Myxococcaceae bacterium]